jgi:hypothetical protein
VYSPEIRDTARRMGILKGLLCPDSGLEFLESLAETASLIGLPYELAMSR